MDARQMVLPVARLGIFLPYGRYTPSLSFYSRKLVRTFELSEKSLSFLHYECVLCVKMCGSKCKSQDIRQHEFPMFLKKVYPFCTISVDYSICPLQYAKLLVFTIHPTSKDCERSLGYVKGFPLVRSQTQKRRS